MMRKIGAPDSLPHAFGVPGAGVMLSWIRRIVGFGTRRPGYAQSLQVEKWLEERFREFGLEEVRFEPVLVYRWEPAVTSLATSNGPLEVPCFPVPYSAWTAASGLDAPTAFLGAGGTEGFERVELEGRIAVLEAHFAELSGRGLKQGWLFVRDRRESMPDGPPHVANPVISTL